MFKPQGFPGGAQQSRHGSVRGVSTDQLDPISRGFAESITPPALQGLGVMRARRPLHDLQTGCSSNDAPAAVEGQWLDDRLVRELAAGAPAAVAFVDYDRFPGSRHPAAIERIYAWRSG